MFSENIRIPYLLPLILDGWRTISARWTVCLANFRMYMLNLERLSQRSEDNPSRRESFLRNSRTESYSAKTVGCPLNTQLISVYLRLLTNISRIIKSITPSGECMDL